MKIIKRSGTEDTFDLNKITAAVEKANSSVPENEQMTKEQIAVISANMRTICESMSRALSVEEIQDLVENQIMNQRAFSVARNYITYRYKRALIRKSNSTDEQILTLLEYDNEEVKQENSNKNPAVNSVQRDYMAGEVSKDITKRFLLTRRSGKRMRKASFISMMRIILRSICTTAAWSILRTCFRTAPSSARR